MNGGNVTYFDGFVVECNPKEMKKSINNKNITTTWGYFCLGFIDFMLKGKSLLEYTNLFSPNKYEKNHKILWKYFQ